MLISDWSSDVCSSDLGLGHAWIPDLGSEQDSRQRSRGTRRHACRIYRTTTSANEVAGTSLAGVAVGTVQRSAVGAADVAIRGRFLRLALLVDLRRLRIGRDAMLQRLAQLDPGGGELQGVRINGHQPAVDQPLVDFRIARLQRQALVDPL